MISAVAVTPSPFGMRRSISTTSGRYRATTATASPPEPASATTSMPGSAASMPRRPSRTTGWSSASTTRIARPPPPSLVTRNLRPYAGPRAGRAGDLDPPVHLPQPLPHPAQPIPTRAPIDRKPPAVVADLQRHDGAGVAQADLDGPGGGVLAHVGQRLLSHPQQDHVQRGGQGPRLTLIGERRLDAGLDAQPLGDPAQRSRQVFRGQLGRGQRGHQPA